MAVDLRLDMPPGGRLETCTSACESVLVLELSSKRLVARIMHDALLHEDAGAERDRTPAGRWEYAGVMVDADRYEATVDGTPVDLTAIEFKLLVVLTRLRGAVAPFDLLLGRVWGPGYEIVASKSNNRGGDPNYHLLQVHIYRLRAKIGRGRIESRRGVGYRLAERESA